MAQARDGGTVTGEDPLSGGLRTLVELSAALGGGRTGARDAALDRAAGLVEEEALEARAVEEALLQSYLFLGYPAALTALARWREKGPAAGEAAPPRGAATRRERGQRLCRRVYGDNYRKLRRNVRRLHPEVDRWMVEEGYGKVLSRPGLELEARELCIVALLAAADWPRQLHSHLRGALNAGAAPARVEAALEAGLARGGEGEAARARWRRVRDGNEG